MRKETFKLPAAPIDALHKIEVDCLKGSLTITYTHGCPELDLRVKSVTIDLNQGQGSKIHTDIIKGVSDGDDEFDN